jgi:hypothetical protein
VAGNKEARALGADARGKGDAVWVIPRTEHVPATPTISFGDLIPLEQQLKVAKEALESFGSPEREHVRQKAVEDARRVLGLDDSAESAA